MNIITILGIMLVSIGLIILILMLAKVITDKDIPNLSKFGELVMFIGLFLIALSNIKVDTTTVLFFILNIDYIFIKTKINFKKYFI